MTRRTWASSRTTCVSCWSCWWSPDSSLALGRPSETARSERHDVHLFYNCQIKSCILSVIPAFFPHLYVCVTVFSSTTTSLQILFLNRFDLLSFNICDYGGQVSLEALPGLSLLLEGTVGSGRGVHPLHRLLSKAPFQAQAGFSKLSRSFPLHQLMSWLRQTLVLNPFGMSACLRSGKKLAWAQQGGLRPHKSPWRSVAFMRPMFYRSNLWLTSEKPFVEMYVYLSVFNSAGVCDLQLRAL